MCVCVFERVREREKNIDVGETHGLVASGRHPHQEGDGTCNPDICP